MTLLIVLLTLVVALQTVLVVGLLRSHARILRRLHELGAGLEPAADQVPAADRDASAASPVPTTPAMTADLTGVGPDGEALGIRVTGVSHDTVLAFLSPAAGRARPSGRPSPNRPGWACRRGPGC